VLPEYIEPIRQSVGIAKKKKGQKRKVGSDDEPVLKEGEAGGEFLPEY